tara:strand:+ start:2299 stop:2463 length:165 start_codon:yes stop_codon:yes gene_type:complete
MARGIAGEVMFWKEMIKLTIVQGIAFDGLEYFYDHCKIEPVRTIVMREMESSVS